MENVKTALPLLPTNPQETLSQACMQTLTLPKSPSVAPSQGPLCTLRRIAYPFDALQSFPLITPLTHTRMHTRVSGQEKLEKAKDFHVDFCAVHSIPYPFHLCSLL